jgi:hypothetical protein
MIPNCKLMDEYWQNHRNKTTQNRAWDEEGHKVHKHWWVRRNIFLIFLLAVQSIMNPGLFYYPPPFVPVLPLLYPISIADYPKTIFHWILPPYSRSASSSSPSIHAWYYSPFWALASLKRHFNSSLCQARLLRPCIPMTSNATHLVPFGL